MTDENPTEETILSDLDLLHSLSNIYYNLKGRKSPTTVHKTTLDNLELKIAILTTSVLENI